MSEYSTQLQKLLDTHISTRIERLAVKIATLEPYSYKSEMLAQLNEELLYTNIVSEFITEYVDNEEEMSDDTRRMITRLTMKMFTTKSLVNLPVKSGFIDASHTNFILYVNTVEQPPNVNGQLKVGKIYDFVLLARDTSLVATTLDFDDIGITENSSKVFIENYYMRNELGATQKLIYAYGIRSDGSRIRQQYIFDILPAT